MATRGFSQQWKTCQVSSFTFPSEFLGQGEDCPSSQSITIFSRLFTSATSWQLDIITPQLLSVLELHFNFYQQPLKTIVFFIYSATSIFEGHQLKINPKIMNVGKGALGISHLTMHDMDFYISLIC